MDKKEIAQTLFELEKACFSEGWTLSALEYQVQNENSVIVVKMLGENPVGYAFGTVICGEAELYRIGVHPEFRGRGLGAETLGEFLAECTEKGAEKFFLEVRSRNAPAVALYKRAVFARIAVRKGYYGDDDALIFEKNVRQNIGSEKADSDRKANEAQRVPHGNLQ